MNRFELSNLRNYVCNALSAVKSRHVMVELFAWAGENAALLGIAAPELCHEEEFAYDDTRLRTLDLARLAALAARIARDPREIPVSPMETRLRWLANSLKLDDLDRQILGIIVRAAHCKVVRSLIDAQTGHRHMVEDEVNVRAIAALLRKRPATIAARLDRKSDLCTFGLVEDRAGNDFAASRTVMRVVENSSKRPERLLAAFIGADIKPSLAWEEFEHLGEHRALIARLLTAAFAQREKGVNLLLYGAPGTGKTEFVRTLAAHLGARALFVGETGEDDAEPTRADRISACMLTRALAGRTERTMLVVDEADDIFDGVDEGQSFGRRGSKVFINRMLETADAPTIWITNHPHAFGPAILRRMMFAIEFREPTSAMRSRMIGKIGERRRVKLDAASVARLAALGGAPAVIDNAVRATKMMRGTIADTERAAGAILRLLGHRPVAAAPALAAFDVSLSNVNIDGGVDLSKLADRIVASGSQAISLCLYGLPGTGKSAFARYLAERMGVEVLHQRASDLLGPYLGQTEAQIAAVFREAADKRAMLILDEADSLLRDRKGAHRSWEVTQVNEMLTWMESHAYPFVCTTNLMEGLDPASLRRFVFKVEFLPLTGVQAERCFRHHFGVDAPRAVADLTPLAPGDFAVVARKAMVLGERDPVRLGEMLAAEVRAKPGVRAYPMGFRAA